MKFLLCAFVVILSIAVYPITLFQNSELLSIFNFIEIDYFNWYRMVLIALMIPFGLRKMEWPLSAYLVFLLISTVSSRFPETSLYGVPMHHEGLLAMLGYFGIYQAVKKHGLYKSLENCLSVVVYITAFVAALQLWYGNFLDFPLFKILLPDVKTIAERWPIYANMGGPNNLGLFCSLFTPYALIRKKRLQFFLSIALLIGSQSRGAWISVLITTAIISRRSLAHIGVVALILSIPMHNVITSRILDIKRSIHFPIQDGDFSGRAYMWKRAIPVLKDSIITGKGPGTYLLYIPQFHERGNEIGFQKLAIDRPHNLFINIWESSGLLSLFILMYWMWGVLRTGSDASLKMGVIGYLIAGVFTDSVLCVTPYLSIFLGGIINGSNNEARRHGKRASGSDLGDGRARNQISDTAL